MITIQDLTREMREIRARAAEPVQHRFSGETDAVLLGKLLMLECLGERVHSELIEADAELLSLEMDRNEPVIATLQKAAA